MTSSVRPAVALIAGLALALVVLVPISAQTQASSKYGGTLVVGLSSGDPDALDPTASRTFSAIVIYRTICEKLYDQDAKSRLVPQLAAGLPVVSKDKLTYTVPLRTGITFNDGTPFTAQAVVTSLQRAVTLPTSSRASDFEPVESFTASGPSTLVVRLKTPYTPLPLRLISAGYILSPTQLAKLGDRFATDPVCVGPFMFDHRVAGDSVTVIKSPHYYNAKAVHLDKIVFKAATDGPAAAAALKAGDLHVLDSVQSTELSSVEQTSRLRVIHASGLGYQGISVNLGNRRGVLNFPYSNIGTPLAASAMLRKAFEKAIDRNALARVVYGDTVKPGCTVVPAANEGWYDASVKCTPYDPADARKLVAASGLHKPTVHLLVPNVTDQRRLAEFIQLQEAAVGIEVVIDTAETAAAQARATAGTYDAFLLSWSGGVDPDTNIFQQLATSGARNVSGYSSPRLDLVLANGRKAITTTARAALYRAAQQIILDDRPIIYLFSPIRYAGISTNVTGVQLTANVQLRVAFAQFK